MKHTNIKEKISKIIYIWLKVYKFIIKFRLLTTIRKKNYLETNFLLSNKIIANCDQNNHKIRFWWLNNYKIKVIIKFSDQLCKDYWYLTSPTKVLATYTIRF